MRALLSLGILPAAPTFEIAWATWTGTVILTPSSPTAEEEGP